MTRKIDRFNMHNVLAEKSFDNGVLCTFAFDAGFFEEYCIDQFNSLNNNANLTVILDKRVYEGIISAPEEERPRQANLRYLLCPINAAKTFHPKLFFFAEKNKGRLVIGSANLTKPGLCSNAELVGCYDYITGENEKYAHLFRQAFLFLVELQARWPNTNLNANLNEIAQSAPWLSGNDLKVQENPINFFHNLKDSLWKQFFKNVKRPVEQVWILSRYFDESPGLLTQMIAELAPKKIKIFTQNVITSLTPEWLMHESVKSGVTEIWLGNYGEENHSQNLHAKAFAVETKDECQLAFGSANFTWPALFHSADKGNVETIMVTGWGKKQQVVPEIFFDPLGTAIRIKNADELISAPRLEKKEPLSETREIILLEANCENEKLSLHAIWRNQILFDQLRIGFRFSAGELKFLNLAETNKDWYLAVLPPEFLIQLNKESTIVFVEALQRGSLVGSSNDLLATNLIDIHSGQSSRQQRYIKLAQNDLNQFYSIFQELLRQNDEAGIQTFLTYCDISVDFSGSLSFRPNRVALTAEQGMNNLGEKNIKIFNDLHELSVDFIERHIKKMKRHVRTFRFSGAENFFHIFFAASYVLQMQCERALIGLESKKTPLEPEGWAKLRDFLDVYFDLFEVLATIVFDDYIKLLTRENKRDKVRALINEKSVAIGESCNAMLAFQPRLETLRRSTLKIKTRDGKLLEPDYNNSNVFSQSCWQTYAWGVRKKIALLSGAST